MVEILFLEVYFFIKKDSKITKIDEEEYFINLSLAGLQDCNFFHSEIGIIDNNGNVISTIDQAKMQSFNQYNMLGRINLLKNCN